MSCTHTSNCPLFAQFAMEPALAIWKKHFCDGEYSKCARYQLGIKGATVPITLLPNGKMIENKVKSKEELGGAALFNAILKGRASMVKSMIVSKMASAQVVSSDGSTPLIVAASVGHLEIVNILLAAGCNPFNTNHAGITALTVTERKKFTDCTTAIKEYMFSHPELKEKATENRNTANSPDNQEAEIKGIVSLLKKLNPFSR